jgi:hypothetical protein
MRHEKEMIDVTTVLERIRDDLVVAIAADQRRPRRRRPVRLAGVVVAAMLFGGTALAAAGVFSPAPDNVQQILSSIAPGVDGSHAVEIGVIDDHPAYAAPRDDGSFCLYFAPNEGAVQRSGPSGTACILDPVQAGQIALAPQLGHDGGFVFGRVEPETATSIQIVLPGQTDPVTTPVAEDGFFLVEFPRSVMDVVMPGGVLDETQLESLTATATDAQGTVVAHSRAPFEWAVPEREASPTQTP